MADLISVPLQSNFNLGAGSKEKILYILNGQPVIPIQVTDDWNVIARVVMPLIHQPRRFEEPRRTGTKEEQQVKCVARLR